LRFPFRCSTFLKPHITYEHSFYFHRRLGDAPTGHCPKAKRLPHYGSDDEIFEPARTNLEREGILPENIGWNPERLSPAINAVILGMHAKEDNPELQRAKELHLPIYSFPEYIFKESTGKRGWWWAAAMAKPPPRP
jgi:hypothetical protein